jgi:hypothetical protein
MMQHTVIKAALLSAALGLVACSEKPQTAGTGKLDQAPYAGTGSTSFTVAGWKAGDKTSWEQALKARGQYGQNEYSRAALTEPAPAK